MMQTLRSLTRRFEGVQFITKIIDVIVKGVDSASEQTGNTSLVASHLFLGLSSGIRRHLRLREEELVVSVLEIIKNGLANEVLCDSRL
jgi:hypothetical protein